MQDREASESAMAALWSGESTWEREDTMRPTNPFLFRDEGMWFSRLRFKWLVTCRVEYTLHMHVSERDCPEFWDEIPFKEGRM